MGGVKAECVIADKGYDSDKIIGAIENSGMLAVIPSRRGRKNPRKHDEEKYKERNVIERLFGRLKHYRSLATRYEKLAINYMSMVYFAAIFMWI